MGLRRSTTKLSARCMRKRENLSAMIESISSICLIFMLIRHCAAPHDKGERAAVMAAKGGGPRVARRRGPRPAAGGRAGGRGRRAELTAGSIVVYSISDRWIVIGCRISSGDVLRHRREGWGGACAMRGQGRHRSAHPTSTSGLLCRSTICDAKFCRHSAAFSVSLTASRYGLRAEVPPCDAQTCD